MDFLNVLEKANNERQKAWDSENKLDVTFKALEFVGEVGELCNNIKKLKRLELGLVGSTCSREDLESEFGDVLITLSLLASSCGINLEEVARNKFNLTSKKYNFNIFI